MSRENRRRTGKTTGTPSRDPVPRSPGRQFGAFLEYLAKVMALAGGAVLAGVMGMTVVSVFGRYAFGAPIPGDYEITELACGVAIFAFLPYCHIRHGNIVVGFFTNGMRSRHKAMLDTVHNIVFAFVAGLITWRMFVGAIQKFTDGETTMFLGIPLYWAYFPALVGAGLLTAVCVMMACSCLRVLKR